MKKHFGWIVALFVAISLVFCFVGCKEPEPEPEQQAPITGDNNGNGGNQSGGGNDSGNGGNQSGGENNSGNENLQNYKYSKDLWGKWKRIDNGQVYTISGDSIKCDWETFDNVVLTPESENILVLGSGATAYRLFRTGGGTRTFTAKVAGFQNVVSRGTSDSETQGIEGLKVNRKSKDIATDTDSTISGEDGTITFEDVVADEVQVITVETENGNTVEVELKPSYDGEHVGTIPIVESGYSFKTTYSIGDSEWYNDNQQLYCFGNNFKEYYLTFRFTNIGDETCSTAKYELLANTNDTQLKLSNTSGAISSITPGSYKDVTVKVSYGDLDEYYKDVTIAIKITDSKLRKTWLDSITLRFYQTPISLNMYAYGANKTGQLNGFVICPDGRSEYFNAWHNGSINKLVPYNKNGSNDYTVVFSATDANNEMAYTLNARHCQNDNQDKFDFEPVFASSELFDFVDSYEDGGGNNTEDTAVEFEDSMEMVKSYVQYGDIDYFKLSLDDVLYSRIEEIKIPKAGIGATAKAVQATIKGKNFKSPLENVTLDCSSNFIVGNLNKRIIDDETMYVDLQIPSNKGDYEVTAKSEFNDAKSTFEVKEYEVETGDYVLKDNRIVRQEYYSELTDEEKEKIFGVIFVQDTGEPVIIGLEQGENLLWAPENTPGHMYYFDQITSSCTGGKWDEATGLFTGWVITGDFEGYDNWEEVCKADPEGSKNAAINYPVFNFANTYGAFAGLEGTAFENGWFVPTLKELSDIYLNKISFENSLLTIEKDIFSKSYFSSSQDDRLDYHTLFLYMVDGHISNYDKGYFWNKENVLVLHKFDPELFTDYEYPEPTIETVEIATAGEGYKGEVLVKIKGENLKGNKITSSDSTFANVTYLSNSSATATITCDGFVGTSSLKVYCGTSSKTGTVNVIPKEDCFTVGDVVFTDGTKIQAENVKYGIPDGKVSKVFGVVASAPYGGGAGKIVGLKTSYGAWALDTVKGYNTNLEELVSIPIDLGNYNYSFTGDIDGSDNWEYICSIDPAGTQDASVNYPIFNFANTYGETAKLSGTDYAEGWYVPTIAELCDIYKNKEVVQTSLNAVGGDDISFDIWSSSQVSSSNIDSYSMNSAGWQYNAGKADGRYVLVIQQFEGDEFTLYEYPEPTIETVEVATVGEGYKGEVLVKIKGKNLKGNKITSSDTTFANVTYLSDSSATATIYCDGRVGTDDLTVTCGSDSATGTVKVIPKEYCFNVGDVVFTDGTRVKGENAKYGIPDSKVSKAFGVVASTPYGGGVGKIVGLKLSDYLKWSPVSSAGYSTEFVDIEEFDIDGSDNWEYVCSIDPAGTQDASVNYPIFNFANTYGETAKLSGTDYAEGWYVPTIAELYDVYQNKDIVQASLTKLMSFSLDNRFWSSSQDSYVSQSLGFDFYQGYSYPHNKDNTEKVLVIQQFEVDEFTLYEYPQPNLTSVEVQIAGEGYKGKLPVTIIGENIKGYEITCNDSTFANLTYLSDSKATATIYCDGTVGTDFLTVTCGSSSVKGTVKVISSSKCFTNSDIGKIIIEDGSLVSKDEFDSSTMTAVAVAAALKYNGAELLGLGLQRGENLQWAPDKTVGYETDFVGIKISQEQTDYDGNTGLYSYKFTGDLDGKDNWEYICGVDPEGAMDAATNYPAFNFANTYGSTYLTGSNYEEGWFIPSANELYDIFVNKDVLHESMSLFGQEYFQWGWVCWSSSQDPSLTCGMYVNISNRDTWGTSKYSNLNVLAVHSFSAE